MCGTVLGMMYESSVAEKTHEELVAFVERGIPGARLYVHPACRTSAESIEARAVASGMRVPGAKSLLMKLEVKGLEEVYAAIVLPGFNKLDSKMLKHELKERIPGMQRMRFATPKEMYEVACGMEPGKMPPIGRPIFPRITYTFFDGALLAHEHVGFNAAHFEKSFIVPTKELIALVPHDGIFACSYHEE